MTLPAARISDMTMHGGMVSLGSPPILIGGMPAARIGDMHACPMVTVLVPHATGAIVLGAFNVLFSGMPQARMTDMCLCAGPPSTVMLGSFNTLIGMGGCFVGGLAGLLASLLGVALSGAGVVKQKKIEESKAPDMEAEKADKAIEKAIEDQKKMLEAKKKELERWNDTDKATFKKWFGKDDDASRDTIKTRINKMLEANKKLTKNNFKASKDPSSHLAAEVDPSDKSHTIELGKAFKKLPATGENSRAGTISHEMSHFNDIAGTDDHVYGTEPSKKLAKDNPDKAMNNADSFEYYLENAN